MIGNYDTICSGNLKIAVVHHSEAEFTTLIKSDGVGQLASNRDEETMVLTPTNSSPQGSCRKRRGVWIMTSLIRVLQRNKPTGHEGIDSDRDSNRNRHWFSTRNWST